MPTNPTHRFELLAGTLRSQPTIRRCECIGGRPPALRGGHQRLEQLPLGVGQVARYSPCSWPHVHTAQNVLACLNACSAQWCLSVPAFAGKFRRCGQLDGRPDLSGLQKIPPGAVGQTNGVGPPACVRTWPGGPGDTRASNPRPTDYRPLGLDSSGCSCLLLCHKVISRSTALVRTEQFRSFPGHWRRINDN